MQCDSQLIEVIAKLFQMALRKSSNRRMRRQKASQQIVFFSANICGAGGTNCKELHPSRATSRNPEIRTNNFELLMLKHDRAYSACEFRRNYVWDREI